MALLCVFEHLQGRLRPKKAPILEPTPSPEAQEKVTPALVLYLHVLLDVRNVQTLWAVSLLSPNDCSRE